jgi:hypothetical protein
MRYRAILCVLVLFLTVPAVVQAGDYYLSDEKTYWWYWDDSPKYEVKVPAKADSYAPQRLFGERCLDMTLTKNGPIMGVCSVAKVQGGYTAIKQAVMQRWQHVLVNPKITSDSEITTTRGVHAKFLTVSAKTPDGVQVMIRLVGFVKGTDAVYLTLFCDEKAYSGETKNTWVKAVNTFNWR